MVGDRQGLKTKERLHRLSQRELYTSGTLSPAICWAALTLLALGAVVICLLKKFGGH